MIAKLDFLRLATWDIPAMAYSTSYLMELMPGGWEQSKWLQYHGWKNEVLFTGTGEQNKKRHSIINMSGYRADDHYNALLELDAHYCTRLDVQVTIRQPENVHLDEVYARIKNHVKSSLIQSDENDTLYIGARASDIFTRLYEKILDAKYLRLEFEIKGKRSRAAWRALQAGSSADEIFAYYLKRVKLPSDIKELYKLAEDGETEHAMNMEIEKDDQKTLEWLQSIDGAMRKALANHNIGENVKILVDGWAGFASNLDSMKEND